VAESGAWMGGIVPYGYRKEGERREARLVVSQRNRPASMPGPFLMAPGDPGTFCWMGWMPKFRSASARWGDIFL